MGLSIIHISDIHIQDKDDYIFSRKNQMIAACKREIHNDSDVIIVCSGDIAYSGEQAQYDLFESFISDICESLRKEKTARVSFVSVPGNHDCHFDESDNIRDTLIDNISPERVDDKYFQAVADVQQSYESFAEKHGMPLNQMIATMEIQINNGQVLFLLVNTAWMSKKKECSGKIVIPKDFFPEVDSHKYKAVFAVYHHPFNWLNPDYKQDFVHFIRHTADMAFVGHEHQKDRYKTVGDDFSIIFSHAKELQDSNSDASAFSVISFDEAFQNYTLYSYRWDENQYVQSSADYKSFHKNMASYTSPLFPNDTAIAKANDAGILINHFAKENVCLSDLFIWPDINKITYKSDKTSTEKIRNDAFEQFNKNNLNIVLGSSSAGKTSIAKQMFLSYSEAEVCCVYINGSAFSSVEYQKVKDAIEEAFVSQYYKNRIDEFWNLPKSKRIIVVDDFDIGKFHGEKRNALLEVFCELFDITYLFISSDIELPSIMSAKPIKALSSFFYYEILPLGNKKRKDLISKWYHLSSSDIDEDEIEERIEASKNKIDTFLANGAGILPAFPITIIGVLQNSDAFSPSKNNSQYGFLYESMIKKSLFSAAGNDYEATGKYSADIGAVSLLAFKMLQKQKTYFSKNEFDNTIDFFSKDQKVALSKEDVFKRMCESKLFYRDESNGDLYRFKYPYIFYFFSGYYIAYHLDNSDVKAEIDHMSERLYIEHYGNIMIFVCHFANNTEVIESVLLNAYGTLDGYKVLDVSRSNALIHEIAAAVDDIVPKVIVDNSDVSENKDRELTRLDEVGFNAGQVINTPDEIDENISSDQDRDFAAISASFKIMDVLGQILQNYPGNIDGYLKISIIDEISKLGLRSVQAIIKTMGYLEHDLVEFIYAKLLKEGKAVSKDAIIRATKQFINTLIAGMVRAMIHKIAVSFNSPIILPAVSEALENQGTIASELILTELKVNCLKQVTFPDIEKLSRKYEKDDEHFANSILSSIMANYLNENRCDYRLRDRICSLFGFSRSATLKKNQSLLTERGYQ